jgi:TonB family protein
MFSRLGSFAMVFVLLGCRISAQDTSPQSSSSAGTSASQNYPSSSAIPVPQTPDPKAGAYSVGGGVTAPVVIKAPQPEYSNEARDACYQGTDVLWLIVDSKGRPQNIRVQRPLGMGLDEKAIEAVHRWRFKPSTLDGQPVAVTINVEVEFILHKSLSPHPESSTQPPHFPGVDTVNYPLIVRLDTAAVSRSGHHCVVTHKAVIKDPDRQQELTTSCIVGFKHDLDIDQGTYPARWKADQKTLEILGLRGKQPGVWTALDCSLARQ